MREICKESIDEQSKKTEYILQKNEIQMQNMMKVLNDIRAVFYAELTESDDKN